MSMENQHLEIEYKKISFSEKFSKKKEIFLTHFTEIIRPSWRKFRLITFYLICVWILISAYNFAIDMYYDHTNDVYSTENYIDYNVNVVYFEKEKFRAINYKDQNNVRHMMNCTITTKKVIERPYLKKFKPVIEEGKNFYYIVPNGTQYLQSGFFDSIRCKNDQNYVNFSLNTTKFTMNGNSSSYRILLPLDRENFYIILNEENMKSFIETNNKLLYDFKNQKNKVFFE